LSRALVTGAAGFLGSTLTEALLREGWDVVGIDAFTDHYPARRKRENLVAALEHDRFRLEEVDLRTAPIERYLKDATHVVHLAAIPGVRASWGESFAAYTEHNVLATQRLLEALRGSGVERAVFASSSSVYGAPTRFPTPEDEPPRPLSPYGVTKLSAEALLGAYRARDGISVVALRYFTVYGPRQRPDMGFHIFFEAARTDAPVTIYGDGEQTRDFTYVDDAVRATMSAMTRATPELTYNVGGGHRVTLNDVLGQMERVCGKPIRRRHVAPSAGDPRDTSADITRARRDLGYEPKAELSEGLAKQWAWQRNQ